MHRPRRQLFWMMVTLLFVTCTLFAAWWMNRATVSSGLVAEHALAPTLLTISAPTSIRAGTPILVTVTSQPLANDQAVQLFLLNTNGTIVLSSNLLDGKATFTLDKSLTQIAGQVILVAQAGAARADFTLSIVANEAVEPVLALVGPRSIRADGEHWTMLTALPNDQFGNAVVDGTAVTVRALHPATGGTTQPIGADAIEVLTAETGHLLAWLRIYSRTKAGRMDMAATSGNAHSPERTVQAVPGPPGAFGLIAEPLQRSADGRHLVTVDTERLTDQFGNQLLDGTAVTFLVTNPDGTTRTLPAQSIDGKATVQIQAPTMAGSLQIKALVLDTTSRSLSLEFEAGIGVAPISLRAMPTADLLTLVAGPLLGPLGQYIPDGTIVRFTLQAEGIEGIVQEITAPVSAGFATAVIRRNLLADGRYTVRVTAGVGEGYTSVELP